MNTRQPQGHATPDCTQIISCNVVNNSTPDGNRTAYRCIEPTTSNVTGFAVQGCMCMLWSEL